MRQALQGCTKQAALDRQDISCAYLAHHELESVSAIVNVTKLHAGVLELIEFIRKENIKTLVEHIVDQHIERYTAMPSLLPTMICCLRLCLTGWLPDGSSC